MLTICDVLRSTYRNLLAPRFTCRGLAATAVLAALACVQTGARADVTAEGDVGPFVDNPALLTQIEDGGTLAEPIIVGGTGSTAAPAPVGRVTVDTPGFTLPLRTTDLFIGGDRVTLTGGGIGADSLGIATVTGFFSEWQIDNLLSVGVKGQGILEVTGGALVRSADLTVAPSTTADDAFVGEFAGSQGYVAVNGFGSRLTNDRLVIGHEGIGRVDVAARGRLETRGAAILGEERNLAGSNNILGTGRVWVDGLNSLWSIGDGVDGANNVGELIIGAEGRGLVEVTNAGMVRADDDVTVADEAFSFGEIRVNGRDSLFWTFQQLLVALVPQAQAEIHVENEGVLRADDSMTFGVNSMVDLATGGVLLTPTIFNSGVIRGDGVIDTGLTGVVTNNGDIRNGAALANYRERLLVTGPLLNFENIDSVGGEMEFLSQVTNQGPNGEIVGVNAILRFRGGLVNSGSLTLDDDTLLESTVVASTANLTVGDGDATILGSLNLAASNTMDIFLSPNDYSHLEVSGHATLGGTLRVNAIDGFTPQVGDTFEIISAGSITGTFANVADSISGIDFMATTMGNTVVLSVGAGFVFSADFDNSNLVDFADFNIWSMNLGDMVPPGTMGDANGDGKVDGEDLLIWQQQLGTPGVVPATSPVPEPASFSLALAGMAFVAARRRRRDA